jgi:hypothetical protein
MCITRRRCAGEEQLRAALLTMAVCVTRVYFWSLSGTLRHCCPGDRCCPGGVSEPAR